MKLFLSILVMSLSATAIASDLTIINENQNLMSKSLKIGQTTVKKNATDRIIESTDKTTVTTFSKGSVNVVIKNNKVNIAVESSDSGYRTNKLTDQIREANSIKSKYSFGTLGLFSVKRSLDANLSKDQIIDEVTNIIHNSISQKTDAFVNDLNKVVSANNVGATLERIKLYCNEELNETNCIAYFSYSSFIKIQ